MIHYTDQQFDTVVQLTKLCLDFLPEAAGDTKSQLRRANLQGFYDSLTMDGYATNLHRAVQMDEVIGGIITELLLDRTHRQSPTNPVQEHVRIMGARATTTKAWKELLPKAEAALAKAQEAERKEHAREEIQRERDSIKGLESVEQAEKQRKKSIADSKARIRELEESLK